MSMAEIHKRKIELEARVTAPDYQTTARDVAEAQELVSQYIDELERLERTAKPIQVTDITDIAATLKSILDRWFP